MLTYPPDDRISAQEAYAHPWLVSKRLRNGKPKILRNVMANLKNFRVFLYDIQ